MVEKTESEYEVGVRSHVLEQYFIRLRLFRSKIITKSRQSLLNESNRIEMHSFLRLDIDRLGFKRFPHVYYETPSSPLYGHKVEKTESDKIG